MIFCTLGTTNFPFTRLVTLLDKALIGKSEEALIQTGNNNYVLSYPHHTVQIEIPYARLISHMSQARALVCHGGAGTILLALRYSHVKPFVLPRLTQYKEHVDNHQKYFAAYMYSQKKIITPSDSQTALLDLRAYLQHPQKQKPTLPGEKNALIEHLSAFTTRLYF